MSIESVPTTPPELTPRYVEKALRVAGLLGDGRVEGLAVEPLTNSPGLLSTLLRLRLTYEGAGAMNDLPRTLAAKLPSTSPVNRDVCRRFGYHRREIEFYRHVAALFPRQVPSPVVCDYDPATDGFCLLMADMDAVDAPDQLVGATPDEAASVIESIARIHATCLEARRPPPLGLPGPQDPEVFGYGEIFRLFWAPFAESWIEKVDPSILARAETTSHRFEAVCAWFAATTQTVVHGDFRLDNILLPLEPAEPAIIVDWQLAQLGNGALDLARFISASITPEVRRSHFDDLLRLYHEVFNATAEASLQYSELVDDVRRGCVMNLPNPISAAIVVDPVDARGAALLEQMVQRSLLAFADLDADTVDV